MPMWSCQICILWSVVNDCMAVPWESSKTEPGKNILRVLWPEELTHLRGKTDPGDAHTVCRCHSAVVMSEEGSLPQEIITVSGTGVCWWGLACSPQPPIPQGVLQGHWPGPQPSTPAQGSLHQGIKIGPATCTTC